MSSYLVVHLIENHSYTHTRRALGFEQLVIGASDGVGVGEGVQVCEQVEPGGHVFGSTWSGCTHTHRIRREFRNWFVVIKIILSENMYIYIPLAAEFGAV